MAHLGNLVMLHVALLNVRVWLRKAVTMTVVGAALWLKVVGECMIVTILPHYY
jgi:hypothetical protein